MPAVSYVRFASEIEEIYSLMAPATLCKMRQALREFGEGLKKTSNLRPVVIARWVKRYADERAPATLDSLLRSFKSACEIGVASGYMKASPFAVKVRVPDFDLDAPAKVRHHSIRDVNAVLSRATQEAGADTWDWKAGRLEALVYIYAYAALRKNEALFLHRDDVDFANKVLKVNPRRRRLKTKASAASVPMTPALEAVLRNWIPRTRSEWVIPNVGRTNPWTGGPPGHKRSSSWASARSSAI